MTDQTITLALLVLAGCVCLLLGIVMGYRQGWRAAQFARQLDWEHLPAEAWLGDTEWRVVRRDGQEGHCAGIVRWTQYGARIVGRVEGVGVRPRLLEGLVCGSSVSCLCVDPADLSTVVGTWMLTVDDGTRRLRGHECRRVPESAALAVDPLSLLPVPSDSGIVAERQPVALSPVNA